MPILRRERPVGWAFLPVAEQYSSRDAVGETLSLGGWPSMDLHTVAEVGRPGTREETRGWRDGDAWLAGGTWLFSEPQPNVRRLIDLDGLGWEPLRVSGEGLAIAATCPIGRLDALAPPEAW